MVLLRTDRGRRPFADEYPVTNRKHHLPGAFEHDPCVLGTCSLLAWDVRPKSPAHLRLPAELVHFIPHLRGGRISGMIEKFREKFPAPVLPLVCETGPAGGEAPRFRRYCAGADMGLSGATEP